MTTPNPTAGATLEAWARLERVVGASILLPVVSDLSVPIHEKSTIKQMGKVPSQIHKGFARGFTAWTQHITTDQDIKRWSKDRRHGISVRTGAQQEGCTQVVAIDGDIDDPVVAGEIAKLCEQFLGVLPMRTRSNSGKFLLCFVMRGEYVKRVLHTAHGAIEFLATGQQFIAIGTHTSGVRYQWKGGMPDELPTVAPKVFDDLWYTLSELYAIEPERMLRGGLMRPAVARDTASVNDSVVGFLEANNWVRSWTADGRLNINCPWSDHHTTADNETATQYFPAGVGGYQQGHFHCLHAHCAGRSDGEYLDAIGIMDKEFEDVSNLDAPSAPDDASDLIGEVPADIVMLDGTVMPAGEVPKPAFRRKRDGSVKPTVDNVVMALERPDVCGYKIAYDSFRDELMIGGANTALHDWRRFTDSDYTELRRVLERNGFDDKLGSSLVKDGVRYVAARSSIDSAQLWLDKVNPPWDGVCRIEMFYPTYLRAVDTPYTRACGLYLWSALAGRITVPGVKADMVPIWKSEPGLKKTSTVEAMAPAEEFFVEIDLSRNDDEIARKVRGKCIGEIAELRGLHGRDRESVLSWVTRRHEEWTPKYREFTTRFPRRFIAIGTTNEDDLLNNPHGERRWLPAEVGVVDIDAIRRDRGQLWAEGAVLFRKAGVQWQDAQALAPEEHAKFKITDEWGGRVEGWLAEPQFGKEDGSTNRDAPIRISDILQSAIGMSMERIGAKEQVRVSAILRTLGYSKAVRRIEGINTKVWVKNATHDT